MEAEFFIFALRRRRLPGCGVVDSGQASRAECVLAKEKPKSVIPAERIAARICVIRGRSVMLDADLAEMYGVTTGNLNLAVRRNKRRFPEDFVFQLTVEELESLLLQNAISKGRGTCSPAP